MNYDLILPFFPAEIQTLLLDPTISDLMINGTNGVYADRGGISEEVQLSVPFTRERLTAAIERIARILGQDLTTSKSYPQHTPPGWFARCSGRPARIYHRTLPHHSKI